MNEIAKRYADDLVSHLTKYAPKKEPASPEFVQEGVMLHRSFRQLEAQVVSDADSIVLELLERAKERNVVFTAEAPFHSNWGEYVAREDGYAVGVREQYSVSEDDTTFCFTIVVQGASDV